MKNRLESSPSDQPEKTPTPTKSGKPAPIDPAECNFQIEWINNLAAIGITPVVVVVPYCEELWAAIQYEEQLDLDLRAVGAGHWDSTQYGDPLEYFFYLQTRDLEKGQAIIRETLDKRGLAAVAKMTLAADYVPAVKAWRPLNP